MSEPTKAELMDELRTLRDRLAKTRDSRIAMHERLQAAEAAVRVTVEQCRREGVSFGRSLANAAATAEAARADAAEARVAALEAALRPFADACRPGGFGGAVSMEDWQRARRTIDTATAKAALDSYLAGKTDSHGFPAEPRSCGVCLECQTDSEPVLCPQGPTAMPRHAVCACEAVGCPEAAEPDTRIRSLLRKLQTEPAPATPCAKCGGDGWVSQHGADTRDCPRVDYIEGAPYCACDGVPCPKCRKEETR